MQQIADIKPNTSSTASSNQLSQEGDLVPLVGLNHEEITDHLKNLNVPEKQLRMRAKQLWNWLYVRGVTDFDEMLNISKELRAKLKSCFTVERPEIITQQISSDGTRKWLIRLNPQNDREVGPAVEAVYIPEPTRATLCISSQVGCTLTCSFCHTGTQKLVRNLTTGEIIDQILIAKDFLGDWPDGKPNNGDHDGEPLMPEGPRKITNIVLMGMGEPLYNFDAVKQAMLITSHEEGLSLSKRRITLSTSGVVPMIEKAGEEIGVMLAISLHAVKDDVRNELVPINKKYPIKALLDACRNYPGLSNARRITFEYVMLDGVNDSDADARALVKLLAGIPAKINLIPFNPWPGSAYQCSSKGRIKAFADIVNKAGYASPVRTPRGRDIMAACGQLKSASLKQRAKPQS